MNPPEFENPITAVIASFLISIGFQVRARKTDETTILSGIKIEQCTLFVDERRLANPGDLLHEAGHLAVASPKRRSSLCVDVGDDPAEEMMAIAWSYAAALHLKLDPVIVFHAEGYNGGGQAILENFSQGRYVGVPMLQWLEMTLDQRRAKELGASPYPHMLKWVRDRE